MKIISNYRDIQPGALQRARLYLSGHPLASLYRKKCKNISYTEPGYIQIIDQELSDDYISIDCAGWYFSNDTRHCTAIEHHPASKSQYPDVVFEYDYMSWRPTYLKQQIILCYHTTNFRYATLKEFVDFFNIWGSTKYIIGLDPTKVKFNYLKYNLIDQLSNGIHWSHNIRVLESEPFELLFVVEPV